MSGDLGRAGDGGGAWASSIGALSGRAPATARPGGAPRGPPEIWLVPTNSSHAVKNRVTLQALIDAGADAVMVVMDAVLPARHRSGPYIERLGLRRRYFPAGDYRPAGHWLGEVAQLARLRRAVSAFVDQSNVAAGVFFNDGNVIPRVFIQTLRSRGIPTVLIPDGIVLATREGFSRAPREVAGFALRKWVYGWSPRGTSGVDRILVMSDTGRRALVKTGVEADRIHVVGSSEYEALAAELRHVSADSARRELCARLDLDPARKIVFYAHQHVLSRREERKAMLVLAEGARRGGGVLLVKFHPRSGCDPAEYAGWAQSKGLGRDAVRFAKSECTSIEAVVACDVCVTLYSTVALEALVCGRPIVVLQYLARRARLDLAARFGCAVDVEREGETAEVLAAVLTDDDLRSRLIDACKVATAEEFGARMPGSTERTAQAILDLARAPATGRRG